jgi:uncharacterized membrane protein YfcA
LTGVVGAITYHYEGGAVDLPAAALLTATAVASAPVAATFAQRVSGRSLLYALTGMLLTSVPLVLSRPLREPVPAGEEKSGLLKSGILTGSVSTGIAVASLGALTGILSGTFGVGGGFIMVPLISAFTGNHQLALGTSLCAMIGPSVVSSATHWKLGNIKRGIAIPLSVGSAIGAYLGTLAALQLNDEQQRLFFCAVMLLVSVRNISIARRMV